MRVFAFLAACSLSFCVAARAGTVYFNGFEPGQPGSNDFYDSTTNVPGQNIAVVASGGGTLHLTAPGDNVTVATISAAPLPKTVWAGLCLCLLLLIPRVRRVCGWA
jgi:hypothetical protein